MPFPAMSRWSSSCGRSGARVSHRAATRWLAVLLAVTAAMLLFRHSQMPLPPHSSHDGFLLVPQMVDLLEGEVPADGRFGMFHPTWFSDRFTPTHDVGWGGFWDRVLGNVQSHTWIDLPHPLAWMALLTHASGAGTWAPLVVQVGYLVVLVAALYAIGRRMAGPEAGLFAGVMALGAPGLVGSSLYIEPHLGLVSMSTLVVCLLLYSDDLKRWGVALVASLALWSLSRSGEGSGEVVIAGLVVIGPVLTTLVRAARGGKGWAALLGPCALLVPFVILADVDWMMGAMERVTRAFADPLVQTDVVAKGGVLSHRVVWLGAYVLLMVTDYALPLLSVVLLWGLWRARRLDSPHRWILVWWLVVPWLALSWMQRKASWYGLALIPPVVALAALGLSGVRGRARGLAMVIALGQWLVVGLDVSSLLPTALTRPLPLHEWRLRRIDFLRPMEDAVNRRVRADLDAVLAWTDTQTGLGPIGLVTMGTQHDYAARYYLAMAHPGLQVVNLTDPKLRIARYQGLHPDDFSALIFLDEGAQPWPPTSEQASWLRQNLQCSQDDPIDAFIGAVQGRAAHRQDGFYVLSGRVGGHLGPGLKWSGPRPVGGLCAP